MTKPTFIFIQFGPQDFVEKYPYTSGRCYETFLEKNKIAQN